MATAREQNFMGNPQVSVQALDIRELCQRLAKASKIIDLAERHIRVAAVVTLALDGVGVHPILVGGGAVEFYTGGGYATGDIDMLAPEGYGEIIGGGQREDSLQKLEDRIKEYDLPREPFEWYLDLRRYGSVPHGGFGLGVERTVAWITGTEHVRETIAFPRMLYRIYP